MQVERVPLGSELPQEDGKYSFANICGTNVVSKPHEPSRRKRTRRCLSKVAVSHYIQGVFRQCFISAAVQVIHGVRGRKPSLSFLHAAL